MKIGYHVNENENLVVGTATYTTEDDYSFGSIPSELIDLVDSIASKRERVKLNNKVRLKSYSKTFNDDVFNEKVGKNIVRDKLLVKDAERKLDKLQIIGKYLTNLQSLIVNEQKRVNNQMEHAYSRLEEYQSGE